MQCASPAQVLFGTADGQVIVMDCHGRMLAHVLLHESDGIVSMSWNCPNFLVEDSTESDTDSDENVLPLGKKTCRSVSSYIFSQMRQKPLIESFTVPLKCAGSSPC